MSDTPTKASENRVAFDYIKSSHFRVVHVDGIIGGLTPSRMLHIATFSERPSIPRHVVNDLTMDGQLGPEVPELMENRQSIVREMDVDLILSFDTANRLREWLDEQIKNFELIEQQRLRK